MRGKPIDRPDQLALALDPQQRRLRVDGIGEVGTIVGRVAGERRRRAVAARIVQPADSQAQRGGGEIRVRTLDGLAYAVDDRCEGLRSEPAGVGVVKPVIGVPAGTAMGMRRGQHHVGDGVERTVAGG